MSRTNEEISAAIAKYDDGSCIHDFWEMSRDMYLCKNCGMLVDFIWPIVEDIERAIVTKRKESEDEYV